MHVAGANPLHSMSVTSARLLAGSLRGEVQKAPFEKTFISQENRDGLLEALRGQIMRLLYDDKPGGMSVLVSVILRCYCSIHPQCAWECPDLHHSPACINLHS